MLARRAARPAGALLRGLADWAPRFDADALSGARPAVLQNFVGGAWAPTAAALAIPDPLTGEPFIRCPATTPAEGAPFAAALRAVPKSGLHNPLKNVERYVMLGEVTARAAEALRRPAVAAHFARLVQRVSPKSTPQAVAEVTVTRRFLENFGGDQVRFLARGFSVPGDHAGQASAGHRWPFGGVAIVCPFNFPIEIPVLQLMGALYMGNRPLLHVDRRVSIVMEEFLRLLHACGLPLGDVDLIHGEGAVVGEVLKAGRPRSTLFTGSSAVGERLSADLGGRVFLEDAGFDWKILGPDVPAAPARAHVAWQCDQDAYACSGQKCSATSILFVHEAWAAAGLEADLKARAEARRLADLAVGPVLSWTTERMLAHAARLLAIPGARLLWGGKPLAGPHSIPSVYGAIEPTAVFVPLDQLLRPEHYPAVTTEVFGPFQVVTRYAAGELPAVLEACERMEANLTAAVVSNDHDFVRTVLGSTVNGTTYAGLRARTTGAPQNHWFGPAGDPRAAGIGTPEAIRLVWSTHREIVGDYGPPPPAAALVQS